MFVILVVADMSFLEVIQFTSSGFPVQAASGKSFSNWVFGKEPTRNK
jgi:hypothetical protein